MITLESTRPAPRAARALLVDALQPDGLDGAAVRLEAFAAQAVLTVLAPTAVRPLTPLPAALVFDAVGLAAASGPVDASLLADLGRAETVDGLIERLPSLPLGGPTVLCAELADAHGHARHAKAMLAATRRLVPHVDVWVVDADEIALLTGRPCDELPALREGGRRLFDLGCPQVVLTGGRLAGHAIDLVYDGRAFTEFGADRRRGDGRVGAKAVFSAGLAARLARGQALLPAVEGAKGAVTEAIDGAVHSGESQRAAALATAWQGLSVDPRPIQPPTPTDPEVAGG